jgi:glycosyltransferase involved in cell wall biosynthesis
VRGIPAWELRPSHSPRIQHLHRARVTAPMLDQITPLILTYNEAPNIARTLERLSWANRIVVVDSFSDDETVRLASSYSQVKVFQRKFDSFENQWTYGLAQTGINSEWVLALDADYILTSEIIEELKELQPSPGTSGYRVNFTYCVGGRPLRVSSYPPGIVLYRRLKAFYKQDGHTQRVVVEGTVHPLKSAILHDDRKSLARWLQSQSIYMRAERDKLLASGAGSRKLTDRLRACYLSPLLAFPYCLFFKGGILDGRAGIYYAFQRTVTELLLSLYLFEDQFSQSDQESKSIPSVDSNCEQRS